MQHRLVYTLTNLYSATQTSQHINKPAQCSTHYSLHINKPAKCSKDYCLHLTNLHSAAHTTVYTLKNLHSASQTTVYALTNLQSAVQTTVYTLTNLHSTAQTSLHFNKPAQCGIDYSQHLNIYHHKAAVAEAHIWTSVQCWCQCKGKGPLANV